MAENKKAEKFDYEKALKQLENIVAKLEDEDIPLEKAIELFTEGKKLADVCLKKLTELEQKVQMILENEKGEVSTKDLGEHESSSLGNETDNGLNNRE